MRPTLRRFFIMGVLLLSGGSLASCTRHYASLPADLVASPTPKAPLPSAVRIRGPIPTTTVHVPTQPVSNITSDNPWKPDAEPRDWNYIVLHHTASHAGSVEEIHETHLGKGWEGIGYHFVIGNGEGMSDGEIEQTFRWREQMHGAHAGKSDYNQHGIGVVLVGNFEESSPSAAQLESVTRLVATLKREYGISSENVIPHRDVKATLCPGKNFPLAAVAAGLTDDILSLHTKVEPRPKLAGRLRSTRR